MPFVESYTSAFVPPTDLQDFVCLRARKSGRLLGWRTGNNKHPFADSRPSTPISRPAELVEDGHSVRGATTSVKASDSSTECDCDAPKGVVTAGPACSSMTVNHGQSLCADHNSQRLPARIFQQASYHVTSGGHVMTDGPDWSQSHTNGRGNSYSFAERGNRRTVRIPGFYSRMFLVPKKDGRLRPRINLNL